MPRAPYVDRDNNVLIINRYCAAAYQKGEHEAEMDGNL